MNISLKGENVVSLLDSGGIYDTNGIKSWNLKAFQLKLLSALSVLIKCCLLLKKSTNVINNAKYGCERKDCDYL